MNRLERKMAERRSDLILWVRPRLDQMPLPMQRYDDPFLPFGKVIINTSRDLLCGYMFDFADYLALGAAGAVALERTIAYVGDEAVSILHGPLASPDYAKTADAFGVDAVTITDVAMADAYLREGVGVFAPVGGKGDIGAYDLKNRILLVHGIVLRILSEEVLYAGRGDDFAEQVRTAVEAHIQ